MIVQYAYPEHYFPDLTAEDVRLNQVHTGMIGFLTHFSTLCLLLLGPLHRHPETIRHVQRGHLANDTILVNHDPSAESQLLQCSRLREL